MSTDTLAQALDAALELLAQGWDVEACLAQFPAHAAALRPLLHVAQELRALAADDAADLPAPAVIDWGRVLPAPATLAARPGTRAAVTTVLRPTAGSMIPACCRGY